MLEFTIVNGPAAQGHLAEIAFIQSTVFREFPYLYSSTPEYARNYLGPTSRPNALE